jgi:Cystathionine beta-lyases/cystathionine gamma-synthases
MPGFSTRAIRAASRAPAVPQAPINVPIYQSSTFEVGSAQELAELLEFARPGHSYSRYSNPTHQALEEALAELEGAEACHITASGMAAVHAVVLSTVRTGEQLIVPQAVYGGMVGLANAVLERSGITARAVDTTVPELVADAIGDQTRLIWLETISNPTTAMADIAAIVEIAHRRNVVVAVDNTFASPYLCNPLALGADLVVHSTTKYIGGHSDIIGGAILGSAERVAAARKIVINAGGNAAPLEAFLALRGLKRWRCAWNATAATP